MKNLLVLTLVLAMASVANAAWLISVNGQVDPPDSEIYLEPSQFAILDIYGIDQAALSALVIGVISGPGTISVDAGTVNIANPDGGFFDLGPGAGDFGMTSAIFFDMVIPGSVPTIIDGVAADGIVFHCDGLGDVTIGLFDMDLGQMVDTQVIHQIPEPITMEIGRAHV